MHRLTQTRFLKRPRLTVTFCPCRVTEFGCTTCRPWQRAFLSCRCCCCCCWSLKPFCRSHPRQELLEVLLFGVATELCFWVLDELWLARALRRSGQASSHPRRIHLLLLVSARELGRVRWIRWRHLPSFLALKVSALPLQADLARQRFTRLLHVCEDEVVNHWFS